MKSEQLYSLVKSCASKTQHGRQMEEMLLLLWLGTTCQKKKKNAMAWKKSTFPYFAWLLALLCRKVS